MLAEMTSRQLKEWQAYGDLEPFGPLQSWWQVAHIKWALFSSQGAKGTQPKDYMPEFDRTPTKDQSPETMLTMLSAMSNQ